MIDVFVSLIITKVYKANKISNLLGTWLVGT